MNGVLIPPLPGMPHGARPGTPRAALGIGLLVFAAGTLAGPTEAPTLKQMVVDSDLVFRGVVEGIQYALSEPAGQEHRRVPYTFVTYRVEEVLRGQAPGETVTLQFIGGANPETKHYMATSHTPRIDVGDEDIMFVRGNTDALVPLVGEENGRFRIIDGQVYTEMGCSVTLDKDGGIKIGEQYRLDAVETTTWEGHVLKLKYGPEVRELPSDAAAPDRIVGTVQALAKNARPAATFVNADPARPIPAPDLVPAPPPGAKPGENSARPPEPAGELRPQRH